MPRPPKTDPRRAAHALAEELRAVSESLAVSEIASDDLERAAALAAELRLRVVGPRRTRWYEGAGNPVDLTRAQREAYADQSPIRGRQNPVAPPLDVERVTRPDGSRAIAARARLGMAYEGPPGAVHGGIVAALFDEVLGAVQGLAERPGVTAILRVRYRQPTPIGEELRFEGWLEGQRDRRLVARASCHAGDTLTADAEGIFVEVDFSAFGGRP